MTSLVYLENSEYSVWKAVFKHLNIHFPRLLESSACKSRVHQLQSFLYINNDKSDDPWFAKGFEYYLESDSSLEITPIVPLRSINNGDILIYAK